MEQSNGFYNCPICCRPIKNKKANFRRHMQLHDQQHGRLKCNYCDKDYQNKSNLKRHLNYDHNVNDCDAVQEEKQDAKSKFAVCLSVLLYIFFVLNSV